MEAICSATTFTLPPPFAAVAVPARTAVRTAIIRLMPSPSGAPASRLGRNLPADLHGKSDRRESAHHDRDAASLGVGEAANLRAPPHRRVYFPAVRCRGSSAGFT